MTIEIYTKSIDSFTGVTIAANGTSDPYTLDLTPYQPDGFMSLQFVMTGTGTARIYYTSSNDNVTYVAAEGVSDIITAMVGAGEKFIPINPIFSKYMRIYVTETGGANSITIGKAILSIQ